MSNNQLLLSRNQARELDRKAMEEFGISGLVLMENAGSSIAEYLIALKPQGPVIICCGKGNNGGDGFVVARYLNENKIPVKVMIFSEPKTMSHDAKVNYEKIENLNIPIIYCYEKDSVIDELASAEWIVDGLFGTGLDGNVRPPFDNIIKEINTVPAKKLAIDIPSGLDCDTGKPLGVAIKANYTLTFVALKKGFTQPEARDYLGRVEVIDIGIPKEFYRF